MSLCILVGVLAVFVCVRTRCDRMYAYRTNCSQCPDQCTLAISLFLCLSSRLHTRTHTRTRPCELTQVRRIRKSTFGIRTLANGTLTSRVIAVRCRIPFSHFALGPLLLFHGQLLLILPLQNKMPSNNFCFSICVAASSGS